ncbi:hypothetical protein ACGFX4_13570 [Kitasatospora sp. NPDC048365]|uniref:COG4315 family predicted lipoprotein n=1 Tax=Kitasatospora sp. NPDC048365 TaxID=3364050 RepID=UPI00371D393C
MTRSTPTHAVKLARVAAGVAAVAALAAGCGSGGSYGGSSGSSSGSPPASTAPAQQPALTTADTPLGTVVTDGQGHTLYRFDKDTNAPSVSNCTGTCATTWPPAAGGANPQLKGIDAKLVSTVTRADGTQQLTLDGWPLYRYAADTKPGDTKGQGVNGIWFAATPTGAKAGTGTQPATPPPASPSGGYGY